MKQPSFVGELGFDLPAEWQRQDIVLLQAPPGPNGFRPNVTVTVRPNRGLNLDAAAQAAQGGITQQQLPDLSFTGESACTLAGLPARRFELTHVMPAVVNGKEKRFRLRRAHVIAVTEDTIYEVSLTADGEAGEKSFAALERLLATALLRAKKTAKE